MELYICPLHLYEILTFSLFQTTDPDTAQGVVQSYAYMLETAKVFCYVSSLCLNVCVCIDLVLVVKNPFTKQDSRMTPYLYGSIIGGLSCDSLRGLLSPQEDIQPDYRTFCLQHLRAYGNFLLSNGMQDADKARS